MQKPSPPFWSYFPDSEVQKWVYSLWSWVVNKRTVILTSSGSTTVGAGSFANILYTEVGLSTQDMVIPMMKLTDSDLVFSGMEAALGQVTIKFYNPTGGSLSAPATVDAIVMRRS